MNRIIKALIFSGLILVSSYGFAAVNLVNLLPANPTVLSSGAAYYLAGRTYDFEIRIIDPTTAWAGGLVVQLTIPNSSDMVLRTGAIAGLVAGAPAAVTSGTVTATYDVTGSANNFFVTFHVAIPWNAEESAYTASRNVRADTIPATLSHVVPYSYGVCSSIRSLNPSLDGDAADGLMTRFHQSFNATALAIVYNVPGAAYADRLDAIDPGEMTAVNLLFDANPVGSDVSFPAIGIASGDAQLNTLGYTWSTTPISVRFRAAMTTGGATENCQNDLSIVCNEIEVTDFGFSGGGGVSTHPSYIRSLLVTGTNGWANVRMRAGGAAVSGNITVVLRDTTDGTLSAIPVASGQPSGSAVLATAGISVPSGNTDPRNYEVYNIYGDAYGSAAGFGQNAGDATRINQPANRLINWDNGDPPGLNSPSFIAYAGNGVTPNSATLIWDPSAMTALDNDFYSYQLYFKKSGTADPYRIINRSIAGYNTADPSNGNLELRTTNSMSISGLDYLTYYDMVLSAIDVFGNEVELANRLSIPILTLPSELACDVTDGITTYPDAGFLPETPAVRPLRPSAIRVVLYVVSSGSVPDSLSIVAAPYGAADMIAAGALVGVENTDYFRYPATPIGPNRWAAYIPSTSPLITMGGQVRFIVETVKAGSISYSDWNSEGDTPPGNPNDYEWTFSINTPAVFTPWPVRILNNVISKKNPVAYPAYYLSEDGYVTIIIYDIKGRPIITLLENAFRRGGINIKENGWRGRNKKGRKCGPGLYYVRITAKSTSGKTLLREVEKVIISE